MEKGGFPLNYYSRFAMFIRAERAQDKPIQWRLHEERRHLAVNMYFILSCR